MPKTSSSTAAAHLSKSRLTSDDSQPRERQGWRRVIAVVLAVAGIVLAAYLLHRIFREYSWQEFKSALSTAPKPRLAAAFAFAAASYFCLTLFDWLASRYAGFPMPWPRAAHASFTALSLGHNIGFAALSSGAVRYRFYTRWGMSREGVAKVILFCGATVALGLLTLIGCTFILRSGEASAITGLSEGAAMAGGVAALALCSVWVLCSAFIRQPVKVRKWSFSFPPLRLAVGQIIVGAINFALVAACLQQSVRAFAEVSYPSVATAYVLANAASLISHVPGGLGIIESVIVYLVPGGNLIAALIVFRVTYFFIPFAMGILSFAITELYWRQVNARRES